MAIRLLTSCLLRALTALTALILIGCAFGADRISPSERRNRDDALRTLRAQLRPLRSVYRLTAADGTERFTTRVDSASEKAVSPSARAAFLAVCTNEWPAGLVPVFAIEKSNRFELRRRPPAGQENSSEPLFFALPPEDEPDAAKLAGWWECRAVRGNGSTEHLSWELGIEHHTVFGRFDQNTQYRFASIAGGAFRSNRLDLRVEYLMDAYLLTGEWRDGKLRGDWRHADDAERGTWEASRQELHPASASKLVSLYEWRRASDDARRYAIDGETMGLGWERSSRALCRVWKIAAGQTSSEKLWTKGPWSDPDFFPIAVWLQSPSRADAYRNAGINTYVGLWRGPTEDQLLALSKAGMKVICHQNEVALRHRDDPAILGWMHGDEPDNAQSLGQGKGYGPPIAPQKIVADYQRIRATDPSRPVLLNLGQGVAWDNYIGRGVRRNHPEDYPEYLKGCDIASFDIYPAVHDHAAVAGKLWFVAYGVERLVQWTSGDQRVWNCLECTRISNPDRKPTPREVRCEAWMSIVHGSRGLIYFVHQFKPTFREAALLDDPEMLAAVTVLNRQITELAPVLNSPTIRDAATVRVENPEAPVALMIKRHGGAAYLFAVAMRGSETTARFTLAGMGGDRTAEVLGESRTIQVTSGSFKDHFDPWEVHIYRLAVRSSP